MTVMVKESFPDTALQAIISRSPGKSGHDIIAIRRSALSPELLSAALNSLRRSRVRHGEQPNGKVTIRFMHVDRLPSIPDTDRAGIEVMLRHLANAEPQKLDRIKGRVRSIEVPLP